MRKKFPLIILLLIAAIPLTYYFYSFYQLLSKSYYVDESKLLKVDTFHLYNSAYKTSDNSGGRFSHSYPKLTFKSTDGYSFAIDKYVYEAVVDKKMLEDTLMHDGLKFTVFTDKKNYDEFKKYPYPIFIHVFQMQIGDRKYVDIKKMNEMTEGNIKRGVIISPAFILFFAFLIFKKPEWWTRQKVIIVCIVFLWQ